MNILCNKTKVPLYFNFKKIIRRRKIQYCKHKIDSVCVSVSFLISGIVSWNTLNLTNILLGNSTYSVNYVKRWFNFRLWKISFNIWLYENKTLEIIYLINNICKGYIWCRKVFINYFHNLNMHFNLIILISVQFEHMDTIKV